MGGRFLLHLMQAEGNLGHVLPVTLLGCIARACFVAKCQRNPVRRLPAPSRSRRRTPKEPRRKTDGPRKRGAELTTLALYCKLLRLRQLPDEPRVPGRKDTVKMSSEPTVARRRKMAARPTETSSHCPSRIELVQERATDNQTHACPASSFQRPARSIVPKAMPNSRRAKRAMRLRDSDKVAIS